MKPTLLLLTLTFLLSCQRDAVVPENPSCLTLLIQQNGRSGNLDFVEIYRYKYQKRYVYYALSDCCDRYNVLFDQSCNTICAPDGGISGKGDGKCADFRSGATEEFLIWKRPQ